MTSRKNNKILDSALCILTKHFGERTAVLYENFYSQKNDEEIILSLQDILSEQLGVKKCKQIMEELKPTKDA